MTSLIERTARATMYLTVIFTTILPVKHYILPINTPFTFALSLFICTTGALTLLYATLCLLHRGFVTKKDISSAPISPNARSCHVCLQFKPERSHHCSSCRQCIKRMDHHCHWLGRCINYHNHAHFVRFLLCMSLNGSSVFLFNSYYLYHSLMHDSYASGYLIYASLILTLCSAGLLGCISLIHLYNQLSMIALNITFIESISCYNYGFAEEDSPYNIGLKHNFEEVFGPLKYLFLKGPSGDGITFKKKYDVEYWPSHFRTIDRMSLEDAPF